MITAQILTVNWTHIFNFVVLALSFSGFIITYNKYMKRQVDQSDIDNLKKEIHDVDNRLSTRVDRVEDKIYNDIKEIKEGQRQIMQHLLNGKNEHN